MKTIKLNEQRSITTPFLNTEEAAKFCDWCRQKFQRMAEQYHLPYAGEKRYPRYLAPVLAQWLIDLQEAPGPKDERFKAWIADRTRRLEEMQRQWTRNGYVNGTLNG